MKKISPRYTSALLTAALFSISALQAETIDIYPAEKDMTREIQAAIHLSREKKHAPVTIQLRQGDYHISRSHASHQLYYISNTTSSSENPHPVKHIGLWLKGLRNVIIDGGGARLITHGEMTTFVIDSCENIVLRNFTLVAADPTVPEMTVLEVGDTHMTARIHDDTRYEISGGKLRWIGEGWSFTQPVAPQVFHPGINETLRCASPLDNLVQVTELEHKIIRFDYSRRPDGIKPGQVYQMRDAIRDEACGFIHKSKNITLQNIRFHFLGNFGIVGQYSENLTYDRIFCEPELGTGRTCAGFADFVQMSGCKGKLKILNSRFEGAQDDPINIHGTHLKAVGYPSPRQIKVRFMHPQSYGFEAFFKGDKIELADAHTLLCKSRATVKSVQRLDNYEILLTVDTTLPAHLEQQNIVVENITWTPDVEIVGNYFARTPTRGILVTTRGKVLIRDNTFYRTPISAVFISDDARNWYESGPVRDVTIRDNTFIGCGTPVIGVFPENDKYEGAVHRNIRILSNRFRLKPGKAISVRCTDGVEIKDNYFVSSSGTIENIIDIEQCDNVDIDKNLLSR